MGKWQAYVQWRLYERLPAGHEFGLASGPRLSGRLVWKAGFPMTAKSGAIQVSVVEDRFLDQSMGIELSNLRSNF